MVRHRIGGQRNDLFDAFKASSDHKEKHDTPICFLEMAGIVHYFELWSDRCDLKSSSSQINALT